MLLYVNRVKQSFWYIIWIHHVPDEILIKEHVNNWQATKTVHNQNALRKCVYALVLIYVYVPRCSFRLKFGTAFQWQTKCLRTTVYFCWSCRFLGSIYICWRWLAEQTFIRLLNRASWEMNLILELKLTFHYKVLLKDF